MMKANFDHLKQIELFLQLPEDVIVQLTPLLNNLSYKNGEIIMREGECDPPVYFVLQGAVRIFHCDPQGKENDMRYIQAGEHFNLPAAFIRDYISPASAAAMGQVNLIATAKTDFARITSETPTLATAVLQYICETLNQAPLIVQGASLRSVRSRLAGWLLSISDNNNLNEMKWSQDAIAQHIGSSQEVVDKTLRAFMQEGILEKNKRGIVIHDVNKLQAEIEA